MLVRLNALEVLGKYVLIPVEIEEKVCEAVKSRRDIAPLHLAEARTPPETLRSNVSTKT
jgi:hypothetical protein